MQELRLVLILVGALAIAALLFHGLWTSRKETNSKFGKKVDIDFDSDEDQPTPMRGFDQPNENIEITKERKEPGFAREEAAFSNDPLFDSEASTMSSKAQDPLSQPQNHVTHQDEPQELINEPTISFSALDNEETVTVDTQETVPEAQEAFVLDEPIVEEEPEPQEDVIVINVHGMGSERFSGNRLFNSLEQNGLVFGDMGIYHRHSDLSGSGKILFSVANMVAPGHFQFPDGEDFSTPGISFFLPLPCHGQAEHNFKLMLQTAQLVSSELGGNILDEKRAMLTPNKIDEYKQRAKVFCRK